MSFPSNNKTIKPYMHAYLFSDLNISYAHCRNLSTRTPGNGPTMKTLQEYLSRVQNACTVLSKNNLGLDKNWICWRISSGLGLPVHRERSKTSVCFVTRFFEETTTTMMIALLFLDRRFIVTEGAARGIVSVSNVLILHRFRCQVCR